MQPPPLSFIVAGFAKCGSTSLCTLLDSHPDIFIPGIKETNFLARPNYDETWDQYGGMFSAATPNQLRGDGSISYTAKSIEVKVRDRIKKHYPDIKLIFIARDPINRIESSFREFHHSGPRYGINTPFKLKDAFEKMPSIIDDSLYWARLNYYREVFADANIHIVFLEELELNTKSVMAGCFNFLGIDSNVELMNLNIHNNSGSEKRIDTKLLRKMREPSNLGYLLAKLPVEKQELLFPKLRLRKPFTSKDIEWDKETAHWALKIMSAEIEPFINHAGRSLDVWSRYMRAKENQSIV